jgi:hypothetical protein
MNYLIGSIKHCNADRINIWAKSALKHCSGQVVLLVLDDVVPENISDLSNYGVTIVHNPTVPHPDINISKFERHFYAREYLKTLEDTDTVLLTDTLDVVFQRDPFQWYSENKNNKLLLTSEGVIHDHEHWNMRGIGNAFTPYVGEIKTRDVFNSGLIMGEIRYVKDLLHFAYSLTINVRPEHTEGIDQPALNIAMLANSLQDITQVTTTSESFAVNCAVAGPTSQFVDWGFDRNYKYDLPSFNENGVSNVNNELYCIVHQYNRIPEWNQFFTDKYKTLVLPKKNFNPSTAVVVCTHSNSGYYSDWKNAFKFSSDDYMLCDVGPNNPPIDFILNFIQDNVVNYTINNLRKSLNFNLEPSDKHWWNNGGGRNIIWFYPHFRMMYFYMLNPNHDYYWFFDDDVTFPDNQLYKFVEKHKSLEHDCMIAYLFGGLNQPIQEGALNMDENMGSYHNHDHNWLTHYPGPGDIHPDNVNEKYGSYFPLVRLSNKALSVLVEEHLNGNYGYSEGYVPTILNHRGLSLYSIYNTNDKVKVDENITVYHRRYLDLIWKHV